MSPLASLLFLVLLYVLGLYVSLFGTVLSDAWKVSTLALGLAISATIYYSQFYSPLIRVREERRRTLVELLMAALIQEHRRVHRQDFECRVNVMLVSRKYKAFGRPVLRISYTLGEFTKAELEQQYGLNVGCAGICLAERKQCLFDRADTEDLSETLSATQRQVTAHAGTILSTPIFRSSDTAHANVAGVLSIDSTQTVGDLGFRDVQVQLLAEAYAEIIGSML